MKLGIVLLATSLLASAETHGLRPRAAATDYPAYAAQNGIQIAAEPLDPEQVKKSFAADLYQNYIVMEVAVFPGTQNVKLRDVDFEIRLNGHPTPIRPVSPEAVASSLTRQSRASSSPRTGSRDVNIYPEANIGYETGTGNYPNGGRRSGMIVGGGVGVGVGGPSGGRDIPPQIASKDRAVIETELTEKGLPSGEITGPVAGYLYFPIPSTRKKYTVSALEYIGDTATVNVTFPPVKKH